MAVISDANKASNGDIEQKVLNSPDVQKTIARIASATNWVSKNPIFEYWREQSIHINYHFFAPWRELLVHGEYHYDKLFFGEIVGEHPTLAYNTPKKFIAHFFKDENADAHPKLAYNNPRKLIQLSAEYVQKLAVYVPYRFRSFIFGKDKIPEKPKGSPKEAAKAVLQGVKVLKRHIEDVTKQVDFDAKVMRLNVKARRYYRSLAATIEPSRLAEGTKLAEDFVKGTFSEIKVSGLEQIVDGKATVADILNRGSVVIVSDHPSYANVPVMKAMYSQLGLEDRMYFIAGKNIVKTKNKSERAWLKTLVTGSGAILIERKLPMGTDGLLYASVLNANIAELLSERFLITIFMGRGRDKGSKIEAMNSIMTELFLNKAEYIVPVAQSHYVIPDDYQLASHESGKGGSSFDALFALKSTKSGPVYITFGTPIRASTYKGASKKELKEAEQEITGRISRLVTLTPTYVLASAVKRSGIEKFTVENILGPVQDILAHAKDIKLRISPDLNGNSDMYEVIRNAAEVFVNRGALSRLGVDKYNGSRHEQKAMLDFYAAKIERALNEPNLPDKLLSSI